MKPVALIALFTFLCYAFAAGQNYTSVKTASKKTLAAWKEANDLIARGNYSDASNVLAQLTVDEPAFIDGWLLLGELYNEEKKFDEGRRALLRVVSLDRGYASKTWLFLSESYWQLDSFEACASACTQFLSLPAISKERKQQAAQRLRNAEFSNEGIRHPVPFSPINLGSEINSAQPEYLPAITGDEQKIVFTRRLGKGQSANEDFYFSVKENEAWLPARPLSGNINTPFNEGAQTLTQDGNQLYYAACDRPGGFGSCDLYFSQRKGDDWTPARNVGSPVCTNAWESQPCIAADGNTLIFVSNRPGGKGGSDLWIARKDKNGKWMTPVNAGDSINTLFDESSPFLHPDGVTLYFTSEGHAGFGGEDIFISRKKKDGTWMRPKNIGYPINSKNDENSLVVGLSGKRAYFASDRFNAERNFDLFYFDLYEAARPLATTFLKGQVMDQESTAPVAATVQLIELVSGNIVAESTADPVDGTYLVSLPNGTDYALTATAPGYLLYSENFSLKNHPAEQPFLLNVEIKKINEGASVVLRNIFFETNSFVLKDESKVELNQLVQLLQQNPTLKILIGGHTDSEGSDPANLTLSDNRAKAVYEFLVSAGIAAARLSYKGFGETRPIAGNQTEEGRAQNRRTEFTVISE